MPSYCSGFLSDGTYFSVLLSAFLCCFIVLVILIASIKQLKSRRMEVSIKILYFGACVTSVTCIMLVLISTLICKRNVVLTLTLFLVLAYFITNFCVLFILLLRLYFTFKESMYALSDYHKWMFIVLSLIMGITCIVCWITYILPIHWSVRIICIVIIAILYFGLSIYGMILFVQKLYKLVKMKRSSVYNDNGSSSGHMFSEQQRRILYTSTKYVTLLSIAMISTWITVIYGIVWNRIFGHSAGNNDSYGIQVITAYVFFAIICIDSTINIVSLYLQFPFNTRYYDKYCTCFGYCCESCMAKNLDENLKKQEYEMRIQSINSIDATTTDEQDRLSSKV